MRSRLWVPHLRSYMHLFETTAVEANTNAKKSFTDTLVESDGISDLVGIDIVLLANVSSVISET